MCTHVSAVIFNTQDSIPKKIQGWNLVSLVPLRDSEIIIFYSRCNSAVFPDLSEENVEFTVYFPGEWTNGGVVVVIISQSSSLQAINMATKEEERLRALVASLETEVKTKGQLDTQG